VRGLPNTGSTSSVALALVMLTLALGGGIAVRRATHGPR
jgi:LPXTG-motif cell wall-anchored protein